MNQDESLNTRMIPANVIKLYAGSGVGLQDDAAVAPAAAADDDGRQNRRWDWKVDGNRAPHQLAAEH